MAIQVQMKSPDGKMVNLKTTNWYFFFFTFLAGIYYKVYKKTLIAFLVYLFFYFVIVVGISMFTTNNLIINIAILLYGIAAMYVLYSMGNGWRVERYLKLGWDFVDPNSNEVKEAKQFWGIK